MEIITYEIDSDDNLKDLSPNWSSFAQANDAVTLTAQAVVGTSIWDWISGMDVQYVYRVLFERIRTRQKRIHFPYRCDSPDRRRFMEFDIFPGELGSLRFESRLIRTEARPPVVVLDVSAPRSDDLVSICSWCKRVLVPEDRWIEIEEAIPILDLFDRKQPSFTHTMCPDCDALIDQAI